MGAQESNAGLETQLMARADIIAEIMAVCPAPSVIPQTASCLVALSFIAITSTERASGAASVVVMYENEA